jgi:hypothetical protein
LPLTTSLGAPRLVRAPGGGRGLEMTTRSDRQSVRRRCAAGRARVISRAQRGKPEGPGARAQDGGTAPPPSRLH